MTIWFDLDGTLAGLYDVEGWLDDLMNEYTRPYRVAKALVNMRMLGHELNRLQALGYKVGVISWLAKSGTTAYGERVAQTKKAWLAKHLGAVKFDEIHIVAYGTPKEIFCKTERDILFDDEEKNRENWNGTAYGVENILEILKAI
jgi:hypothetical protein